MNDSGFVALFIFACLYYINIVTELYQPAFSAKKNRLFRRPFLKGMDSMRNGVKVPANRSL